MLRKNNDEQTPDQAATTIQKHVRGFLARRKFGFHQLKNSELEQYLTFVVGNDPVMPAALNAYHESDKKIALIATSGMRAVSLACELGNDKNTPKIILIDNSKQVYKFWRAMKKFLGDADQTGTKDLFLNNLPYFLDQHPFLFENIPDAFFTRYERPGVKYPNQNINTYFRMLIEKHGYDYVRAVIIQAVLIKQSWADKDIFVKIKNILSDQGIDAIYMYPSNIVAEITDEETRKQVLDNIAKMNPRLSIHTNTCPVHLHPETVYLLENNHPSYVANTIFAPTPCKPDQTGFGRQQMLTVRNIIQEQFGRR